MTAGTLSSAGTVTNILNGTITSVLGATITAGTLSSAGTITNILEGTITNVLGATITAGTLSSAGTVTNLLNGTITSVLGATITAGTLSSAGTVTNLLNGTITSVLGATITAGTLSSVTSISQRSFIEQTTTGIATANAYTPLPAVTTSVLGTYSFFINNTGANPVNTRVEISADGTNYFVDTTGDNPLAAGSIDVIVPARFLKYTRLSYQSTNAGAASTINVSFNAQGT
ncbi:hypothetical protein BK121_18090 [Paenibacillus odorifer]|nr:hypothetical protein BK121_18090 [Paenibacillus odorifer]